MRTLIMLLALSGAAFAQPAPTRTKSLQFSDGVTVPVGVSAAGTGRIRYNNALTRFEQSLNGAAYAAFGGGGSGTFAVNYTNGASQTDSTVLLDATRLGLRIRDGATPITGSLFQVQSSAGGSTFLDIGAASALVLRSGVVDGASAVAMSSDTTTAWSTTGAKLMQWNTNAVEQLSLKKNATAWSLLFANTAYINSNKADGASAIGSINDTAVSFVTSGAKIASWQTAGSEKLSLKLATAGWGLDWGANAGFYTSSIASGSARAAHVFNDANAASATDIALAVQIAGTSRLVFRQDRFLENPSGVNGIYFLDVGTLQFWAGGINVVTVGTNNISSTTDLQTALGTSALRYSAIWARAYNGKQQVVASSTTPAFDCAGNGEYERTILTANIASWTMTAGNEGEICTLGFKQSGAGSFTLSGTPANVKFGGGTLTLTAGSTTAMDLVTVRWDATDTVWREIGRSLNQ